MTSSAYLINKSYNSYLVIAIFTMLTAFLGTTIDSLIIGNMLGKDSLAAIGLITPIVSFIAAASGVMTSGAVTVCNIMIGKNEIKRVNQIFTMSTTISIFIALVLTFLLCFANTQIASLLGAEGELIPLAADYIKGYGLGVVPIMLNMHLMEITKMDGSRRLGLYSVAVLTIINSVLDILFAGPLGFGMYGIAISTSISYMIAFFVMCLHFFNKNNTLRIAFDGWSLRDLKELLMLGAPTAINRISLVLRVLALNRLLISVGSIADLTAFSIQNTLSSLISAVPIGVGHALNYTVGLFYGEADVQALKKTLAAALKTGIVICGLLGLSVAAFATPIVSAFGLSEEADILIAARATRYLCASLVFAVISNAFARFYQNTRNPVMANFVCIAHNFAFAALAAYALASFIGTDAVWLGMVLGGVLSLVAIYIISCFKKKRFKVGFEDLMLLRGDFGSDIEEVKEFSIGNNFDEALVASEEIHKFCVRNGINRRDSYLIALSVEEMAGNVIRHGFIPGKKQFLDIRILRNSQGLVFRMRDDGARFNPLEYDSFKTDNDNYSHIGIKLMRKAAKDIQYRYTMSMNNLIILL